MCANELLIEATRFRTEVWGSSPAHFFPVVEPASAATFESAGPIDVLEFHLLLLGLGLSSSSVAEGVVLGPCLAPHLLPEYFS
jgi:hypothetical protein